MDVSLSPSKDPLLTALLHGLEALSTIQFFMMAACFLLYMAGSYQEFSDTSNLLLLSVSGWLGVSAAVVNSLTLLVIILWSIRHRRFQPGRFIFSLFSLVLGLGLSFMVAVIRGFISPA